MNPKYPSNLDPKLREAYDRVMGTGTPQAKGHQQTPQPEPPKAAPRMVTEAVKKHQDDNDSGVIHYGPDTHTKHEHNAGEKHEVKQEIKPSPSPTPAHTTTSTENNAESKSSATPVLLGIIGVLFFLGYALFWAQIFGFNLLPSL